MVVCPRCKTENDDSRIRCGSCGNNITKRGDYMKAQGPAVVVLGSVEDLRRARQQGEVDTSNDDPTALGWLEEEDGLQSAPGPPEEPKTRRVSVRDIDKVSGLTDLKGLQAALLGDSPPVGGVQTVAPSLRIERSTTKRTPALQDAPAADAPPAEPHVPSPSGRVPRPATPAREGEPRTASGRTTRPGAPGEEARSPSGRFARGGLATPPPPARSPLEDSSANDEPVPEKGPTTAYLVGELFPQAFELTPSRKYLMGRDPRASIFLPSAEVSRRHAGIACDAKGDYWIEDLRSANGTYLNGRAILKRRLRAGDLVQVGPFGFKYVKATFGQPSPQSLCDPNGETQAMRAVPGALTGDIEKTGVPLVLALLFAGKRNGVLTLRAGRHIGRIFFTGGHIVHAQFGRATGEEALASLIPAEGGVLHFTDEKVEVKQTVTRTTKEILGEWLKPPSDAKTGSQRGKIVS